MEKFSLEQLAELERIKALDEGLRPEALATLIHKDQLDKLDKPYIDHPRRVNQNVSFVVATYAENYTKESLVVAHQAAWLHDVIEDSGENGFPKVSPADLLSWGINPLVVKVVEILTKSESTTLDPKDDPYYQRIAEDKVATLVKLCDISDNCNGARIKELIEKTGSSKFDHYWKAVQMIAPGGALNSFFHRRRQMSLEITFEEWEKAQEEARIGVDFFGDTLEALYFRARGFGMDENRAADWAIRENEAGD